MDVSPVFCEIRGTQSNQTMKDSTEGSNSYAHLLWEKLNWYVDQFAQDSGQTKGDGYGELMSLDFFFFLEGGGGNDVLSSKKDSVCRC